MNCHDCREWLQRRLDGEALVPLPELEQHLADCPACRAALAAADLLLEGIKQLPAPVCPPELTQRLTAALLKERRAQVRRMRVRLVVTVALAASLLLMALVGNFLPPVAKNKDQQPIVKIDKTDPVVPEEKIEAAPPLGRSVDQARHAFAALTERLADRAKVNTRLLLAPATPAEVELPPIVPMPEITNLELENAAVSLRQAGQEVADSLQPMAKTARRALDYFVRELPVLEGSEK